ncbi:MAG: hypothetical protein AAF805_14210 [Planctomycetota bacterium]
MAVRGLFEYARRALFSAPSPEQQLLRATKRHEVRRVVELGVDSLDGSHSLLATLVKRAGEEPVRYVGFDAFDERSAETEPLSLIDAHRRLSGGGARVRLTPGGPVAGVAAEANALADTDLLILSSLATDAALASVWFFLPRMCHAATLVLRRDASAADDEAAYRVVPVSELVARSGLDATRRAA